MTARKQVLALAGRMYDNALDRGEPFTLGDLTERLTSELLDAAPDVVESLAALAADSAMRSVDRERTATPPQATLLDSLEQAIPVGGGRRLSRRNMRLEEWVAHLEYVADNTARVTASAARENRRFSTLAPFLTGDATTEDAVKAWQEAHPGEVLA